MIKYPVRYEKGSLSDLYKVLDNENRRICLASEKNAEIIAGALNAMNSLPNDLPPLIECSDSREFILWWRKFIGR